MLAMISEDEASQADVAAQLVVVADQIRAFAARMNLGAIGV